VSIRRFVADETGIGGRQIKVLGHVKAFDDPADTQGNGWPRSVQMLLPRNPHEY